MDGWVDGWNEMERNGTEPKGTEWKEWNGRGGIEVMGGWDGSGSCNLKMICIDAALPVSSPHDHIFSQF